MIVNPKVGQKVIVDTADAGLVRGVILCRCRSHGVLLIDVQLEGGPLVEGATADILYRPMDGLRLALRRAAGEEVE